MARAVSLALWILTAGAVAAAALTIAVLILYPNPGSNFIAGLAAVGSLAALAGTLAATARIARSPAEEADRAAGLVAGALCSSIWLFEIGFNNLLDPQVATGARRFAVDNLAWALVAGVIFAAAAIRAFQRRMGVAGLRVGFWSGCSSGLAACIFGLLLIVAGMRYLARDPLNAQEYAARVPDGKSADLAAYLAYETLKGSLLHLFVLGIGFGCAVGVVGGGLGQFAARMRGKLP